jgi:DNA-binding MarR family transcriptional regulator
LNDHVTAPVSAPPRRAVRSSPARDQVDVIVDHWLEGDPNLDVVTKAAAIRLCRVAHYLERELRRELAPLDAETWEFDVLLTLRRVAGHRLSAGALTRVSQVTSGAISNRLARLEQRGWITREIDPHDRRHVLVTLTSEGLARAGDLVATKTVAEQRVLAGLDRTTLERMSDDLRSLLVAFEGPAEEGRSRQPGDTTDHAPVELSVEHLAQLSCIPESERS